MRTAHPEQGRPIDRRTMWRPGSPKGRTYDRVMLTHDLGAAVEFPVRTIAPTVLKDAAQQDELRPL